MVEASLMFYVFLMFFTLITVLILCFALFCLKILKEIRHCNNALLVGISTPHKQSESKELANNKLSKELTLKEKKRAAEWENMFYKGRIDLSQLEVDNE